MFALADGVTITLGPNIWSFDLSFIMYLVIAAVIGLIAEYIVGWRVPFGIIGAIIAGVIGIWLMTHVIVINGININGRDDLYLFNVPMIRAFIGAIVLIAIWHLVTGGLSHRRRRSYREAA